MEGADNGLSPGWCLRCSYSLRGLQSNRCPECGQPFDPANPNSMNLYGPIGPVPRWMLSPIGKPIRILSGLTCLSILWGVFCLPFGRYTFHYGTIVAACLCLYVAPRVVLQKLVRLYLKDVIDNPPSKERDLKLISILILGVLFGYGGQWPEGIISLHRPLLDRYAKHMYYDVPTPRTPLTGQWIGLIYFSEVNVTPTGIYCRFPGDDAPVIEWREDNPRYEHSLGGNWYLSYEVREWWMEPLPRAR